MVSSRAEKDLTGAQSVDRALRLLALVSRQAERGMPLSTIVDRSGLNKPTVRRLLLALIRAGLIEQNIVNRRYYIGEEAYVLGSLASRRYGLLQMSMSSLIRLSRKTEDSSFVSVRRDTYSVCLHREEGTFPIRTHALQAGFEHPLGVGAGSLAMLASLPDDEIAFILDINRPLLMERFPKLHPDRIWADVHATRETGVAFNPGLVYANSWGMGMAVLFPDGKLAGALSIAAIDSRMQAERQGELTELLRAEARTVEAELARTFKLKQEAERPSLRSALERALH
ncbi:IclR family transcriptional regulator [Limoniibacter endophyticus]|uniref:Transcriptional regulator n=1 Tax=Limoniibacter endophyticus TaxID=1565040 RepID=A0A8J3DHR4_9HYPH|nr:IclR family transcriptional regulator [Limoniibacter endophyticus]GHC72896.1 transcriptional regulator [Limoniibacter endophyticus]